MKETQKEIVAMINSFPITEEQKRKLMALIAFALMEVFSNSKNDEHTL